MLVDIAYKYNFNKYVVDIGASTGVSSDPCYPFITNTDFKGLCVEGDYLKCKYLKNNISHTMNISNSFVTPTNILSIMQEHNVPKDLFLLKIDIDGYDLDVIREIMKSDYKPILFICEINEKIPPPMCFEIPYNSEYKWDYSHCFGFSLQSGKDVFESGDYYIVKLYEMNNIICVRKDQKHIFPEYDFPRNIKDMYQNEYINNTLREKSFPWNKDVDHWLIIEDTQQLNNSIEHYFTKNNIRSTFKNKNKTLNKDFLLYYNE